MSDQEEEVDTPVDEDRMDQTEELFSDPDKSGDEGIESERVVSSSVTNRSMEFGATTPTSTKRSNPFRVSVHACSCTRQSILFHLLALLR